MEFHLLGQGPGFLEERVAARPVRGAAGGIARGPAAGVGFKQVRRVGHLRVDPLRHGERRQAIAPRAGCLAIRLESLGNAVDRRKVFLARAVMSGMAVARRPRLLASVTTAWSI